MDEWPGPQAAYHSIAASWCRSASDHKASEDLRMIDRGYRPRNRELKGASKEPHVPKEEDPMDKSSYPGRHTGGLWWRTGVDGIIRGFVNDYQPAFNDCQAAFNDYQPAFNHYQPAFIFPGGSRYRASSERWQWPR
jgi:hypothetical protein